MRLVTFVAVCAAALVCAGSAVSRAAAPFDGATLSVDVETFAGQSFVDADVELSSGSVGVPGVAARVDLTIPSGYQLDLSGKVGSTVGDLIAAVTSGSGSGFAFLNASVVVEDPAAYAADPVAQACAPGSHTAVWLATAQVLGNPIELPMAVDQVDVAGTTPSYVVHYCPFVPPSPAYANGLTLFDFGLALSLSGVPTVTGTYAWSALVTPASNWVPDASSAFELRALVPIPNELTARVRYDAKAHSAVLTGKLTAGGQPRAGVTVYLRASGSDSDPTPAGRTDATGSFSILKAATATTTYTLAVPDEHGACTDSSTAPAGCKSQTLAAPPGVQLTVVVPRKTDPKVSIRARDQALARRSLLTLADFPGGQQLSEDTGAPCAAFAPDLRKLTVSGQASSPYLLAASQRQAAYSSASVFTDLAGARTAFAKDAQLAAMKCEATDYASGLDPDAKVAKLTRVYLPGAGNELRAFRAVVTSGFGEISLDLVFIRVGRVVIELHLYAVGGSDSAGEIDLSRSLARRAH